MAERHQEFLEAGAEVISLVNDTEEPAVAYFKDRAIPFPCLQDPGRRVYDLYGVWSKPTSLGQRPGLFVIDRQGTVRYAHLGWQQWEIPSNHDALEVCRGVPCRGEAEA